MQEIEEKQIRKYLGLDDIFDGEQYEQFVQDIIESDLTDWEKHFDTGKGFVYTHLKTKKQQQQHPSIQKYREILMEMLLNIDDFQDLTSVKRKNSNTQLRLEEQKKLQKQQEIRQNQGSKQKSGFQDLIQQIKQKKQNKEVNKSIKNNSSIFQNQNQIQAKELKNSYYNNTRQSGFSPFMKSLKNARNLQKQINLNEENLPQVEVKPLFDQNSKTRQMIQILRNYHDNIFENTDNIIGDIEKYMSHFLGFYQQKYGKVILKIPDEIVQLEEVQKLKIGPYEIVKNLQFLGIQSNEVYLFLFGRLYQFLELPQEWERKFDPVSNQEYFIYNDLEFLIHPCYFYLKNSIKYIKDNKHLIIDATNKKKYYYSFRNELFFDELQRPYCMDISYLLYQLQLLYEGLSESDAHQKMLQYKKKEEEQINFFKERQKQLKKDLQNAKDEKEIEELNYSLKQLNEQIWENPYIEAPKFFIEEDDFDEQNLIPSPMRKKKNKNQKQKQNEFVRDQKMLLPQKIEDIVIISISKQLNLKDNDFFAFEIILDFVKNQYQNGSQWSYFIEDQSEVIWFNQISKQQMIEYPYLNLLKQQLEEQKQIYLNENSNVKMKDYFKDMTLSSNFIKQLELEKHKYIQHILINKIKQQQFEKEQENICNNDPQYKKQQYQIQSYDFNKIYNLFGVQKEDLTEYEIINILFYCPFDLESDMTDTKIKENEKLAWKQKINIADIIIKAIRQEADVNKNKPPSKRMAKLKKFIEKEIFKMNLKKKKIQEQFQQTLNSLVQKQLSLQYQNQNQEQDQEQNSSQNPNYSKNEQEIYNSNSIMTRMTNFDKTNNNNGQLQKNGVAFLKSQDIQVKFDKSIQLAKQNQHYKSLTNMTKNLMQQTRSNKIRKGSLKVLSLHQIKKREEKKKRITQSRTQQKRYKENKQQNQVQKEKLCLNLSDTCIKNICESSKYNQKSKTSQIIRNYLLKNPSRRNSLRSFRSTSSDISDSRSVIAKNIKLVALTQQLKHSLLSGNIKKSQFILKNIQMQNNINLQSSSDEESDFNASTNKENISQINQNANNKFQSNAYYSQLTDLMQYDLLEKKQRPKRAQSQIIQMDQINLKKQRRYTINVVQKDIIYHNNNQQIKKIKRFKVNEKIYDKELEKSNKQLTNFMIKKQQELQEKQILKQIQEKYDLENYVQNLGQIQNSQQNNQYIQDSGEQMTKYSQILQQQSGIQSRNQKNRNNEQNQQFIDNQSQQNLAGKTLQSFIDSSPMNIYKDTLLQNQKSIQNSIAQNRFELQNQKINSQKKSTVSFPRLLKLQQQLYRENQYRQKQENSQQANQLNWLEKAKLKHDKIVQMRLKGQVCVEQIEVLNKLSKMTRQYKLEDIINSELERVKRQNQVYEDILQNTNKDGNLDILLSTQKSFKLVQFLEPKKEQEGETNDLNESKKKQVNQQNFLKNQLEKYEQNSKQQSVQGQKYLQRKVKLEEYLIEQDMKYILEQSYKQQPQNIANQNLSSSQIVKYYKDNYKSHLISQMQQHSQFSLYQQQNDLTNVNENQKIQDEQKREFSPQIQFLKQNDQDISKNDQFSIQDMMKDKNYIKNIISDIESQLKNENPILKSFIENQESMQNQDEQILYEKCQVDEESKYNFSNQNKKQSVITMEKTINSINQNQKTDSQIKKGNQMIQLQQHKLQFTTKYNQDSLDNLQNLDNNQLSNHFQNMTRKFSDNSQKDVNNNIVKEKNKIQKTDKIINNGNQGQKTLIYHVKTDRKEIKSIKKESEKQKHHNENLDAEEDALFWLNDISDNENKQSVQNQEATQYINKSEAQQKSKQKKKQSENLINQNQYDSIDQRQNKQVNENEDPFGEADREYQEKQVNDLEDRPNTMDSIDFKQIKIESPLADGEQNKNNRISGFKSKETLFQNKQEVGIQSNNTIYNQDKKEIQIQHIKNINQQKFLDTYKSLFSGLKQNQPNNKELIYCQSGILDIYSNQIDQDKISLQGSNKIDNNNKNISKTEKKQNINLIQNNRKQSQNNSFQFDNSLLQSHQLQQIYPQQNYKSLKRKSEQYQNLNCSDKKQFNNFKTNSRKNIEFSLPKLKNRAISQYKQNTYEDDSNLRQKFSIQPANQNLILIKNKVFDNFENKNTQIYFNKRPQRSQTAQQNIKNLQQQQKEITFKKQSVYQGLINLHKSQQKSFFKVSGQEQPEYLKSKYKHKQEMEQILKNLIESYLNNILLPKEQQNMLQETKFSEIMNQRKSQQEKILNVKTGKVVVLTNGRFAGRKGVVVRANDDGTKDRKFPHALVAGVDRYPRKVIRRHGKKAFQRRTSIKPFIKFVNYNHFMPTRYQVTGELEIKEIAKDAVDPTKKADAKKALRKTLEEKYRKLPTVQKSDKASHLRFFFKKLRF